MPHAVTVRCGWCARAAAIVGACVAIVSLAAPPGASGTESAPPRRETDARETPTATPAGGTPQYGIRPVLAGKTTLRGGGFSYAVTGGSRVDDALEIVNYQDRDLHLVTYGADLIGQGPATAPAQESDPKHEVGAWIRVPDREITIPARATIPVPFTLTVPTGIPPGDHVGAVVTSTVIGRSASGLAVETRAAITVQVHVPGTVHAHLTIRGFDVRSTDGGRRFSVRVRNTGNVLMTLHGRVRLSGDRDPIPLKPNGIYVIPDGEATFTGVWNDTPRFARVDAVAELRAFINDHHVGTFNSDTKTLWFVDWFIVGLALLAVIVAFTVWFGTRGPRRRRRERRNEEREVLRQYRATTSRANTNPS